MELVKSNSEIVQKLVLDGDLSRMNPAQKVQYYNQFCESLGLNPLTQPFQIIKFQGKERLYATKDCTEQLRKIHGVGIIDVTSQTINDIFLVTAKAKDKDGKLDCSTGAVNIKGLSGDNLANAFMKAETKAKRRVTLSICGLGILDETEAETMKGAVTEDIVHEEIPPVYPAESPKKNGLHKEHKQPDEDEQIAIDQWGQKIKECKTVDELLKVFMEGKSVINNTPSLYALKEQKKKELSLQTN